MADKQIAKTYGPLMVDEVTGALLVKQGDGLPEYGTDPTGADAYAEIVTAPARECHFIHVAVENFGMILSLDGGSTDHFAVPANVERLFGGLKIPSGAVIQGKNLVGGSNFTNGRVSVW